MGNALNWCTVKQEMVIPTASVSEMTELQSEIDRLEGAQERCDNIKTGDNGSYRGDSGDTTSRMHQR